MPNDHRDTSGFIHDVVARVLGRMRDPDAPVLEWKAFDRLALTSNQGTVMSAWAVRLPVGADDLGAAAHLLAIEAGAASAVVLIVDDVIEAQLESGDDPSVSQLVATVRMQVTQPARAARRRAISQAIDLL